jgi:two-component system cell cycle sensor histidine kinase/response regulator CckA
MDPTDQPRVEEAVHRSEDLLPLVTANLPIVLFAINRDGIFTLSDGKGLAALGLTPGQVVGLSVFDVYRDVPDVLENIRLAFTGVERSGPNRVGDRVFDVTYSPIRDACGGVDGIAGVAVDITEQANAADRLRQTRDTLSVVLDSVPQAIFWKDRNSVFVGCNSVYAHSVGLEDPSLIVGKDDFDVAPTREAAEKFRADDHETMETGQAKRHIVRTGLRQNGERFWSDTTKVPLVDRDGHVFGVLGVYQDITEETRTQQALREKEAAIASSINGVVISGIDSRLTYANQAFLDAWGYDDQAEIVGRPVSSIWRRSQEHANRVLATLREAGGYSGQETGLRKDGTEFQVQISAAMIRDNDGVPIGMMASLVDLTDKIRAEEQRLDMERRLLHSQKLESLGVLAGGIAHDFNNLLMAVLGNLDLAVQHMSPASAALSSVEQAIQATRRATDLTRQMLAYSGKGRFVVHRLNLGAVLRENSDLFRASIPKTVTLDLTVSPDAAVIDGDPGQIQQIVMNLITNASDAIGEASGRISLESGVVDCTDADLSRSRVEERPPAGRYAYLQVSDNGHGMDDVTQERLFDPFFTTKFTGRGLGMSAVLGIVSGHQGAILVDSAPAAGTSIRVLFPAVESAPEPGSFGAPASRPAARRPARGRTILVVDDEAHVRKLCLAFVERLGHQSLEAADGEEALALFRQGPDQIDCVLLDLTMPKLDGVATFRAMRTIRPDVPVILSSGYSEQDVARRFDGEGLTGFLQKPFRLKDLKSVLDGALAGTD